jgi:hypothetical protein
VKFLTFLMLPILLFAASIQTPIEHIDGNRATIKVSAIDPGVSGFIVHPFNEEQRTIVASAVVSAFDAQNGTATLTLSPYKGLQQNSLPHGTWKPQKGDIAVLAYSYERAMLIAPNDDLYHEITSRIQTIHWVHPDGFAAFLSYEGHGTPLASDMRDYCESASVGLLYMYLENALFTVDCKSLALLDITPFEQERKSTQLPFYSNVTEIPTNWFGEGSDTLETYDPYYMKLLVLNNTKNEKLFQYLKSAHSKYAVLLEQFEIEK